MTARRVVLAALLAVAALSAGLAVVADLARPGGEYRLPLRIWLDLIGVVWAAAGAVVVLGRPRHVLGWLVVTVGALTQAGVAVEAVRRAGWIADSLPGHLLAFVAGAGIFLMLGLVPLLYPSGRLPSRRWRPLAATIVGGVVAMMAQWLRPRLAGWPWPFDEDAVGVSAWTAVAVYGVATVITWVLTVARIVRSRPPERQQLVLLLAAVAVPLLIGSFDDSELVQWLTATSMMLLPAAIAIGILRYRMLGIELVLRRGLLYAGLTACVVIVHAALTWLGGRYLGAG